MDFGFVVGLAVLVVAAVAWVAAAVAEYRADRLAEAAAVPLRLASALEASLIDWEFEIRLLGEEQHLVDLQKRLNPLDEKATP